MSAIAIAPASPRRWSFRLARFRGLIIAAMARRQ